MARCKKYGEEECIGHDCIDRVGTPCVHDSFGKAGTEDVELNDIIMVDSTFNYGCGHSVTKKVPLDGIGPDECMAKDMICPDCDDRMAEEQIEAYSRFDCDVCTIEDGCNHCPRG